MAENKMESKMASTLIFVFTISLQPFNRFSLNFHQKSQNIFPNLLKSSRISIWQKTKWRPKWRPPRYLCLLYLFNRSTDFHKIFTKNLGIYIPTYRNLLEFQYGGKQNGVQNGVHLDICVYYISSTVQPIFIKFSPKISKKYLQLSGICYNFNMAENKMASKMASTDIFVFTISLQPFNRFSSNFHQKF